MYHELSGDEIDVSPEPDFTVDAAVSGTGNGLSEVAFVRVGYRAKREWIRTANQSHRRTLAPVECNLRFGSGCHTVKHVSHLRLTGCETCSRSSASLPTMQ